MVVIGLCGLHLYGNDYSRLSLILGFVGNLPATIQLTVMLFYVRDFLIKSWLMTTIMKHRLGHLCLAKFIVIWR